MQIRPTSFAFTPLLGFLAAVPYSGIDINLPAPRGDWRHAWREPPGSRPDDERLHAQPRRGAAPLRTRLRPIWAAKLAADLALELGEGEQHVESQTPHRRRGVELLLPAV